MILFKAFSVAKTLFSVNHLENFHSIPIDSPARETEKKSLFNAIELVRGYGPTIYPVNKA